MRTAWLLLLVAACGDNVVEQTVTNPQRDSYGTWIKVQPDGIVCGNDTPYKFWVNFSQQSDNLVVVLEPGGACWDYDSCTGKNGIRGAANVDGLPDDHYMLAPFISPFLNRNDPTSPSTDWNYVYIPYCTGDVHTGVVNRVYTDDQTGSTIQFNHDGHAAVVSVVDWIDQNFTHVPKMLVTGCSAGGVGAAVNYHFLRNGVHAAEMGYLLDDSGPIFPSYGYSGPMHAKIRDAWALDTLHAEMPWGFQFDDMGTLNTAIADEFPNDRLATTFFERDFDFSLYSYERFYNFPPKDQIMAMWAWDTSLLTQQFAQRENLYYYLPYWRNINDSHCTTVINFVGSDIPEQNITLSQWVSDLVNDKPLRSYQQAPVPGEDP